MKRAFWAITLLLPMMAVSALGQYRSINQTIFGMD